MRTSRKCQTLCAWSQLENTHLANSYSVEPKHDVAMNPHPHFTHLKKTYPKLSEFFVATKGATYPPIQKISLEDAFVKVVNSQMLSTKAASAILSRVEQQVKESGYQRLNELTAEEFRTCGMSRAKIRSIQEFTELYNKDPTIYEAWRNLTYEELCIEVDKIWGASTWTAQMLAMFYFGNQDVFPDKDLAIRKGVDLIRSEFDKRFNPAKAAPYRTLLARCIWHAYDVGYWK